MRSPQFFGVHLHCVCQYIGGVSLQNHKIHNPGVTREPAKPDANSHQHCEYIGGISLQSQEIHSAALSREAATPKIS